MADKCDTATTQMGRGNFEDALATYFGSRVGRAGCCVTSTCQAGIRQLVACGREDYFLLGCLTWRLNEGRFCEASLLGGWKFLAS
jgi:hypothetical protein